ncbi:hypothetical protein FRC02_004089 [Tulasnella sp. 418]|nr:hypothetical protein FRC02_004089 [Tulasnella sp. 418]
MLFLGPRAYVFITLNAARLLSIIVLLLVFASNVVIMANDIKAFKRGANARMIVNDPTIDDDEFDCDYFEGSTVPNQAAGIFFAIVNRLFVLFVAILLILSEISWPKRFFVNYIPVLGPDFGVGILGAIQVLISASILSHHVDMFPRVSAFFLFSVGIINILLGLIFRDRIKIKRSLTEHKAARALDMLPGGPFKPLETAKGSIFTSSDEKSGFGYSDVKTHHTGGSGGSGASFGFGRQGSKAAELKGYFLSRPLCFQLR